MPDVWPQLVRYSRSILTSSLHKLAGCSELGRLDMDVASRLLSEEKFVDVVSLLVQDCTLPDELDGDDFWGWIMCVAMGWGHREALRDASRKRPSLGPLRHAPSDPPRIHCDFSKCDNQSAYVFFGRYAAEDCARGDFELAVGKSVVLYDFDELDSGEPGWTLNEAVLVPSEEWRLAAAPGPRVWSEPRIGQDA